MKCLLWAFPLPGIPPLSGREEASRPRKTGEDCLSAASSAAPEGDASLRARKPDNSGGASWFVLLAIEKNEHKRERVTPHPMRGPVGGGKGKDNPLAGILWIPHQVRNDHTLRVECGMTEQRGPVKGACHPAPRCGVQSGRQRKGQSPCGYSLDSAS